MDIQTIERKADVAIGIIHANIDTAESVLCQKKGMGYPWYPGRWSIPGGHIKPRENPEEALRRELSEEFRYDFRNFTHFFDQPYRDELRRDNKLIIKSGIQKIFLIPFDGKLSDVSISEGVGFAFLTQPEIQTYPFIPHDQKALERFFCEYRR